MISPVLLAGGASALLLAGGGVAVLGNGGKSRKRLNRRVAALSQPKTALLQPGRSLAKATPKRSLGAALKGAIRTLVKYDPNVPTRAGRIWIACIVSLILARGVVWLAMSLVGTPGWFAFPVVTIQLIRSYFGFCARSWREKLFQQFPDSLATIVRAVRVGVSLPEGIRRVADEAPEPTATIFRQIADEMSIGSPLHDALADATSRTGLPEYRFFATALVLQARTGGGLAATLEGLGEVIRKRVSVKERGKALSGEAKASAGILAVLPMLLVVGLLLIDPDYMGLLFTTKMGHAIFAVALMTEGMGIFVMRSMIIRALS